MSSPEGPVDKVDGGRDRNGLLSVYKLVVIPKGDTV